MTRLVDLELGAVSVLRLVNPPLNLVTLELTAYLEKALVAVAKHPDVRVLVVAGNDRAFCAGSDIGEFEAVHCRVVEAKLARENAVYSALAELPFPTIAALEGDALGGGLELALCCDVRIAAEGIRLGLPEVRIGAIPGSGGTQRLTRLVGPGRAKRLILSGEIVDARTAFELGVVEMVVPPATAESASLEFAQAVAQRAPLAVREAKRLIDGALDVPLVDGLVAELAASERVFASEDILEGSKAFREKRPPRFQGR